MAERKIKLAVRDLRRTLQFIFTVEFWRMTVLWPLSLLLSCYLLISQRISSNKPRKYPRLKCRSMMPTAAKNPVCVITGATSGLGAAAARALSREGFFVILVGRSSNLLSKAMFEIREQNENAQLEAFVADMASFSSIMKFKVSLQQWLLENDMHPSVQLLVNNAGILATSCRITTDALDEMMATNYVGAFCLTKVLLPLLMDSPVPSRVVNVTSFTHRNVHAMQVDKEFFSVKSFSKLEQYPFARIYEYSKLCLLMFSYELHRKLSLMDSSCQLSINAADPGVVRTNIMHEVPSCLSGLAFLVLKLVGLLQSPESGVHSILDAALAPPDASGLYFYGGKGRTIDPSALSLDPRLAERLWTASSDLFLELKLKLASNKTSTS
ncbi:hypothetical protein Dimus_025577 [Dionaea muscipula]